MVERRCDLQRLNSYQISGQAIDYKDTSKEDVEVQDEVQNQGSLTSSLSSSAVWPDVVTTGDLPSGSAATEQCVEDLKKDFLEFQSKWINDAVQEVHFFFSIW